MKIMFDDLTYEAQVMLLSEAGVSSPKEMKWDIFPVLQRPYFDRLVIFDQKVNKNFDFSEKNNIFIWLD